MTTTLTLLERAVLEKLLAGRSTWLQVLREQYRLMQAKTRKLTGAGFSTQFLVPEDAPKVMNPSSFCFGDVSAEINDLRFGAGFLLYIRDGVIHTLEGYSYEEPWPENIHDFRVYYTDPGDRDETKLLKSARSSQ